MSQILFQVLKENIEFLDTLVYVDITTTDSRPFSTKKS